MLSARCGILIPYVSQKQERSLASRLEEATGLALAIDLDIAFTEYQKLREKRAATLFGKGKVEEIAAKITEEKIGLMIVDGALTPIQQRNLEKEWKCKVIDRTALILEIFGARARTREGVLQVELASLNYQKSRIVRSWTHLERQRGGFGFLGGPGETQKEADRRMIDERIRKIKTQLETVTRTRRLHRESRKAVPYPVIALVGYTNAGKSTLFNALTNAEVLAQDKLFATLDPTMRALRLPSGLKTILSDTVGFVSNLPHELVAAFRATLEEVIEADLILHVRDIASPESDLQARDVQEILKQLRDESELGSRLLEVHNKSDLLSDDTLLQENDAIRVSALKKTGLDALLQKMDSLLLQHWQPQGAKYSAPLRDISI
jgi:GTP-binding protein HflX